MRCITANVLQTKVDAQCDKRVICIQTTSHPTKYEFDFPSLFRASRLLFTGLKLSVLSHARVGRDAHGNTPTIGVLPRHILRLHYV